MTTKYDNMITAELSHSDVALDGGSHSFDLTDDKGRQLGYHWNIFPCTVTPITPDGSFRSYRLVDPALTGERVRIFSGVTRDGKAFGPRPNYNDIHADLETARREVVRRAEDARKRYARQFKQGPALLTEILNGRG